MTDNEGQYEDGSGPADDAGASEISRRMNRPAKRILPDHLHPFLMRQSVAPFETAIAAVAVGTGILNFFGASIAAILFNSVLPAALITGFNIGYLLSGFAIWFGLGWSYRNLEAFGLILLLTALVVRAIALWATVGVSPITVTVFIQAVAYSIACTVRLYVLMKGRTVLMITPDPTLPLAGGVTGGVTINGQ